MRNLKSLRVIIFYFAFCIVLIWQSLLSPNEEKSQSGSEAVKTASHIFSDVHYFQKREDKPEVTLVGKELMITGDDVSVVAPIGDIYLAEGKNYHYQALTGSYIKSRQEINLIGNVEVKNKQGNMKCQKGYILVANKYAECAEDVVTNVTDLRNGDQLYIKSRMTRMWWSREYMQFLGNVSGSLKRKYAFEGGVKFSSEKLSLTNSELKAEFENNVQFEYEGVKSRSGRAELFLENYNKELKYYVLYDDIEVEQKIEPVGGDPFIRKAFSEVLEAFNRERKIVLKGAPRVLQGKDMTRGYKITLFLDREIMEVDDSSSVIKIKK